jgi:hypothetical protein
MKYIVLLLILVGSSGIIFTNTFAQYMGNISNQTPEYTSPIVRLTEENTIPPLKQFKSGIHPEDIKCKESLTLVTKYDGSPSCIKPETKQKLIERGWIQHAQNFKITNSESKLGTFYAQPMLTSAIIKKDSTVRVYLFSYAITDYSDNNWIEVYDEIPKNIQIGIVKRSDDNIKEFAKTGKQILPEDIDGEITREDGYFAVYLTANQLSKNDRYDLSVVSIDNTGVIIEKPMHITITEDTTKLTDEKILRIVSSTSHSWIFLDNISEHEYWKIEDARKPWPASPILNITDDNIHPAVKKMIDAMWEPSGKYNPYEYDKNILVKDTPVRSSGSEQAAISDWLKKIHDKQFERNLDDSSTNYIMYEDRIYYFSGGMAD